MPLAKAIVVVATNSRATTKKDRNGQYHLPLRPCSYRTEPSFSLG
jgi:hypothetical protein